MGVYLGIRIKENVELTPGKANRLWFRTHPIEKEEASLQMNFSKDQQGPTIHFYTEGDLLKDAQYMRDVQKRGDLGFKPSMSDQEAIELLQQVFPAWCMVGSCELKLSGEHYCTHKLKRVKEFINTYKDFLVVNGYKDLLRYIAYDTNSISFLSSSYCGHCLLKARRHDIFLPVDNNMVDATGKNIKDLYEELLFGTSESQRKRGNGNA